MGDAAGEHPGLARTGTGHHQQRPAPVDDGASLRIVQVLEQDVGVGDAVAPPWLSRCRRRHGLPTVTVALSTGPLTITGPVTVTGAVGHGEVLELVDPVEGAEPAEVVQRGTGHGHSHSMVPGGFDVMSRATRLTPSTSLMIRLDSRSRRS